MEPEHAHLALRIRETLTESPRHPPQTKDAASTHFYTLWSEGGLTRWLSLFQGGTFRSREICLEVQDREQKNVTLP